MNRHILIDNIIQQTMVLIAQLATSGGVRAPLAHVADRVFVELARALEKKGLSRKVSADMFGMALRSYRRRLQRLSESQTVQGRSLWTAILDYLQAGELRTRADVLAKFHRDDEAQVRGILSDLSETGLVFQIGRGAQAAYRAASEAELHELERSGDGLKEFVWLLIYLEGPISLAELLRRVTGAQGELEEAVSELCAAQRVQQETDGLYRSNEIVLQPGAASGWEAGMLDHFRAVVVTLGQRLRAAPRDDVGGSTYSFDIWPEHPLADDVYQHLGRRRTELSELRRRVEAFNEAQGMPAQHELVTIYVGQNAIEQAEESQR